MTLADLNVDLAKEMLAEDLAQKVPGIESYDLPLLGDEELVRGWLAGAEGGDSRLLPQLRDFLEYVASVKNLDYNTEIHYVNNPMVDRVEHTGLYRHAYTRVIMRRNNNNALETWIVQVLRKGFITELVKGGSLDWSEGRVQQMRVRPGDGTNPAEQFLDVRWANVSPFAVESVCDSINALTVATNEPTLKGFPYGTGWHRIECGHRPEEDGSASILLRLAIPEYTLTGFNNYDTARSQTLTFDFHVPRELAQSVINASKVKGASTHASYPDSEGLVTITISQRDYNAEELLNNLTAISCSEKVYRSYYWGVEDPSSYAISTSSTAGETEDKQVIDNGDGSFDVIITKRLTQYRELEEYVKEDNDAHTLYETQHHGVYTEGGVVKQVDDDTTVSIPTSAAGRNVQVFKELDSDCSERVRVLRDQMKSQTSTSTTVLPVVTEVETRVTNTSAGTTPTAATNVEKTVQNVPTPNTQYDVTTKTKTYTTKAATGCRRAPGMQTAITERIYYTGTTLPDAPVFGERQFLAVPNQQGSASVTEVTTTPVTQTTGALAEDFFEYTEITKGRHSTTPADYSQGLPENTEKAHVVDNDITEYASYMTEVRNTVGRSRPDAIKEKTILKGFTETRNIDINAGAEGTTDSEGHNQSEMTATTGVVKTLRSSRNRLYLYDNTEERRTYAKLEYEETFPTRDGTATVYVGRHLKSDEADVVIARLCTAALSAHPSVSLDDTNLIDMTITSVPNTGGNEAVVFPQQGTVRTWYEYIRNQKGEILVEFLLYSVCSLLASFGSANSTMNKVQNGELGNFDRWWGDPNHMLSPFGRGWRMNATWVGKTTFEPTPKQDS